MEAGTTSTGKRREQGKEMTSFVYWSASDRGSQTRREHRQWLIFFPKKKKTSAHYHCTDEIETWTKFQQ
jgi:hypothetical protein